MACSQYPTLFVQSDDCKQNVNYRNITVYPDDIVVHESVRIDFRPKLKDITTNPFLKIRDILKDIFKIIY